MAATGLARTVLALAVLGATGASHAAPAASAQQKMLAELKRLAERVDKLERRNAELESRLTAAAPSPALTTRVEALEQANHELTAGLESDRMSERDPDLITRLKAVEAKTDAIASPARLAEALDGIKVEGSVAAVAQRINDNGRSDSRHESLLSWRGDIGIALPAGEIGHGKGLFFTHLRVGQQGNGFTSLKPTFTGAFNSLGFQADADSQKTVAIVAEAYYQLTTPLGDDPRRTPHQLQLNVGKMDPFVFFDQNAIADNEATKFLNNVFVHNPLLDSGHAVGADEFGFAPGVRLAYRNDRAKPDWWQVSVAAFGAGNGAGFGRSFEKPFVIGQLEYGLKAYGLDGHYRLYGWRNGQYDGFDGTKSATTGWGASIDQRVHEDVTLFARYGQSTQGKAAFDRAVTVGAEVTGDFWGRGADTVGMAWAWLRSSQDFRAAAPLLDGFGFEARGAEQVAELYYRWHVNKHLSLTPDLQYVRRAAADPDADPITTVGLRALYAF